MTMSISNWSLAHISRVCNNVQYGAPYVECFLVWVGVDCLRFVSRVKDLKQWASVFSATCGFRNHHIKSGYERSRVTSTRHDASCA